MNPVNRKQARTRSALLLARLSPLALCAAGAAQASVVSDWNATALAEVRAARLGPPIVARALAVTHTCMYDAWSAYDAVAIGTVLDGSVRRPAQERHDANKATAVSYAAYRCLLNLFPAGAARLSAVMSARGYNPNDTTTDVSLPAGIGNSAAAAVIQDRANDGANQYGTLRPGAATPYADYTGYLPRNTPLPYCAPSSASCPPLQVASPNTWQPLISDSGSTQSFIAPHWGRVRPFGFASATDFDRASSATASSISTTAGNVAVVSVTQVITTPYPSLQFSTQSYSAFVEEALQYSRALTPATKLIVEYWADGPASELPPGHWGLFGQFVSRRDNQSIDQDVKMFFIMHNASMDAGIAAWHLKRKYDSVRPITAVRYLKQGQLVQAWGGPGRPIEWVPGEKWTPYNPGSNLTPAFPGFVSGHTTFSCGSATVLKLFKVSDRFDFSTVIPANFGRVEPGVPNVPTTLSYATFSDAATEAGISRLYGGIHFSEDNDWGRPIGIIVGAKAWNKAQRLFSGTR
jgi:PAP2 superfamily